MNIVPLINFSENRWSVSAGNNLNPYTFDFQYLPNSWFRQTTKKITQEAFTIGKLSYGTIHRYHSGLVPFFTFLKEGNYSVDTFEDLTPKIIEEYVHYLLMTFTSPSTRSVKLASLKHHLKFGQMLGWEKFPKMDLFDGTERRTLQTSDTLKSMLIDDRTMTQIDGALDKQQFAMESINEIVVWGLITLIRHTGMRLHEALLHEESFLTKDLTGKPLLEVRSTKTHTDRYIPVNSKVVKALRKVAEITRKDRELNSIESIFVWEFYRKTPNKRKIDHLTQYEARDQLHKFRKKYGIEEYFTYHQFRHNLGTELINGDMSMSEVMQYLGHDSSHSTRLYAKVRKDRLASEYKKVGFIGKIVEDTSKITEKDESEINEEQRLMAQLPDGVCAKPIKETVIDCKKPNACLFCPKFITTPEFLEIHKDHLSRIKSDKQRYMEENLIGTDYLLNETEKALEEIITKLEVFQSSKGGILI